MKQLARLPTRKELAQTALLATLTGAAIVLAGILTFGSFGSLAERARLL
jgi:hypothetical protein